MKHSIALMAVIGCLMLFSLQTVSAGSLLERFKERRAERLNQDNEALFTESSDAAAFANDHITVRHNIAYGDDKLQQLDSYAPRQLQQPAPVVVMVHGGAWRIGDKASSNVVMNKVKRWVPQGIVFISVNYRMLPDAAPAVQAADIAKAVAYVQQHATEFQIDPHQLVLMGHSAGAHLISLLATDVSLQQRYQVKPWLATVALDSAAYDVVEIMGRSHYRFYDAAFGKDMAYWQQNSPKLQMKGKIAPFLAVCSSKRPDKPCEQAEAFVTQAKALGSTATLMPEAMTHKEINRDVGVAMPYTTDIEHFLSQQSERWAQRLQPRKP
jgi:acetyl esterase/lipase